MNKYVENILFMQYSSKATLSLKILTYNLLFNGTCVFLETMQSDGSGQIQSWSRPSAF